MSSDFLLSLLPISRWRWPQTSSSILVLLDRLVSATPSCIDVLPLVNHIPSSEAMLSVVSPICSARSMGRPICPVCYQSTPETRFTAIQCGLSLACAAHVHVATADLLLLGHLFCNDCLTSHRQISALCPICREEIASIFHVKVPETSSDNDPLAVYAYASLKALGRFFEETPAIHVDNCDSVSSRKVNVLCVCTGIDVRY